MNMITTTHHEPGPKNPLRCVRPSDDHPIAQSLWDTADRHGDLRKEFQISIFNAVMQLETELAEVKSKLDKRTP